MNSVWHLYLVLQNCNVMHNCLFAVVVPLVTSDQVPGYPHVCLSLNATNTFTG